jgi:DNA polymerase alpha subunit A
VPLPIGFLETVQRNGSRVEIFRNERALLNFLIGTFDRPIFIANLSLHDPDIIVGHNFIDFDLDVILHRLKASKAEHWSRIGRLRRTL